MANNPTLYGSFVPTTSVWDIDTLRSVDVTSPQFKELLVRLYQNINAIALSLNTRDAGYYDTQSFVNGQVFFPNPALNSGSNGTPTFRQVLRKVINFGALPNTTSKSVAHEIAMNGAFSFTRIYGCSTDPVALNFIPLPYPSLVAADTIELSVDATNVTVTTGSNWSAYTTTYIVIEWLTN